MALFSALIPAVVGLVGSEISSSASRSNVESTNAVNANLNEQNMAWQTNMSNTAMQRRVSDLKASGLNPYLAVGEGGASSPGFSPIAMQQNQQAGAFGQGVSQVGGNLISMKLANAQANNAQAAADKTNAETQSIIPAQQQAIMGSAQQSFAQATKTAHELDLVSAQIMETRERSALENTTNMLKSVDYQTAVGMRDALISSAQSEAAAKKFGLPYLQNMSDIQKSNYGKVMNVLNGILDAGGKAMGIASGVSALRQAPGNMRNVESSTGLNEARTADIYSRLP